MFELTDDNVILTSNRKVITIMLYPDDRLETMRERIKKYFPNPSDINEEYLLETMLMWRNKEQDGAIAIPLQTLYLTPATNQQNEPVVELLMRKRGPNGKAMHEDTDTILVNSCNVDAWIDELILNFTEYHYFVTDFMIAQIKHEPEVTG
jgi:hypothetical protein